MGDASVATPSALPGPLAAWGPALAAFDESLARALVPMLERLALLVGPLSADDDHAPGEPSGYHGVTTRGPYERLLPSEWLLADELPDEFLRRAAAREHLFYGLASARPRGRSAMAVFVDVGPEHIGAPRNAALASLLVLARRAATARAAFGWALLQDSGPLQPDVGEHGLPALLRGTADFVPDPEALGARLGPALRGGDAWLITGDRGARLGESVGASVIAITDVLEPGARDLAVQVRARGRPSRALRLALPDRDACVRLLRDPFAERRAPAAVRLKQAPLVVAKPLITQAPSNVRTPVTFLMALCHDGAVLSLPLPRSARASIGAGRTLRAGKEEEIVAAGRVDGLLAVLARRGQDLAYIEFRGKRSGASVRRAGKVPLNLPPSDGRLRPMAGALRSILYLEHGGRLLEVRPGNAAREIPSGCAALLGAGPSITLVRATRDGETHVTTLNRPEHLAGPPRPWLRLPSTEVHVARSADGGFVWAYRQESGVWVRAVTALRQWQALMEAPDTSCLDTVPPGRFEHVHLVRIAIAPGAEVAGVTTKGLIVLEEGGRQLSVVVPSGERESTVALPEPAVHVACDPTSETVVCMSASAAMRIVSMTTGTIIARVTREEAAP